MSIVIRSMNMEMPSKCIECKLMRRCGKDDLDYVCMPARVYVEDLTNACKPRPEYCPLVELPPHGRLIDADALIVRIRRAKELQPELSDLYENEAVEMLLWVGTEPTIIEAEEVQDGTL